MPGSQYASIQLISRQEGDEEKVQNLRGEVFAKGNAVYIRYEEPQRGPQGGITRTMIKILGGELKIIRHGEVESEQTFRLGQRLPGFYRSPYMSFQLSTATTRLEIDLNGIHGSVEWEYDFYVFEELSGHFALSLHIWEEAKNNDTESIRTN